MDTRRLLEAALPAGVEWASLRRVRTRTRGFEARDGRFESASDAVGEGYMIEVAAEGQAGYAATASSDPSALREAAARALILARSASGRGVFTFDPDKVRPATQLSWRSPRTLVADRGADWLVALATSVSSALRVSDRIVQGFAEIEIRNIESEFVSTSGASVEQCFDLATWGALAIARDGSITQRRTVNGPRGLTLQGGAELFDTELCLARARQTGEQAVELLTAMECPSITSGLVLAPDQMMLQIHESVGHPLELDRMLGDERNYAGSTFVSLKDIGNFQYGSGLMNITFDPDVPGEPASSGADDIGNPACREYLVKDGILVRGLGSLESQVRCGAPGVADQRAQDWYRAPIDRMANLNLEPGASSFDEVLASVGNGVYMESNRSWSIDDYRNKFQFGCEYGRLIVDGKLGAVVRNPNYRGVSSTFWRNLCAVGDRSTFGVYGTPNCGKGEPNQIITVGHASPVCAFRDVEIFGGAS